MNKELTIQKLKEIRDKGEKIETGIPLPYKGETRRFNSFKIPLNYLLYNKKNGRIASRVKSYETSKKEIDITKPGDKKLIEKFIWQAHLKDNKKTEASIAKSKQLVRGIVKTDGIIIDGNRRASILNKIYEEREKWKRNKTDVAHAKYFVAIILPDDVTDEEIEEIEIATQFGEESKIDYNPIEKYLKAKDFRLMSKTNHDIARNMNKTLQEIDRFEEIMNLMDLYLDHFDYPGIYTQLDGREDLFINLNDFIKKLRKGTKVNWAYDETEVAFLKMIAFDYIREKHEGKAFRSLFKIFGTSKDIWEKFKKSYLKITKDIEEESVEDTLEKYPEDESKGLEARDVEWTKKIQLKMDDNLFEATRAVEDFENADKPEILIKRAIQAILSISVKIIKRERKSEIKAKLKELKKEVESILKTL